MTLSRDQEEKVRRAIGALVDTTPQGLGFEGLLTETTLRPHAMRWPIGIVTLITAFVVVILLGAVSLLYLGTGPDTGGPLDDPIMAEASQVEPDDIGNPALLQVMSPSSADQLYSIPVDEFRAFALIRDGDPPHLYATSCDVLNAVDLPNGWKGTCLERTIDGVRVSGIFTYGQRISNNTYADENGWLWYATDCPAADVLLLAGADALPAKETTERERVEASAEGVPEYTVIPRNGWVWERSSEGAVVVSQVEDYMLQRTIESAQQCPNTPSHNGMGIPIAYQIGND